MKINTDLAWRVRLRGLTLPVDGDYEVDRVRQIAIRQKALLDELDALDEELKALAVQEINDVLKRHSGE